MKSIIHIIYINGFTLINLLVFGVIAYTNKNFLFPIYILMT